MDPAVVIRSMEVFEKFGISLEAVGSIFI